jgi:O-antigen ligase
MPKLRTSIASLMGLFAIGIFVSMAALSFAVNVLAIVVFCHWLYTLKKTGTAKNYWIKLGPDWALWLYWLTVILGAIFIPIIPDAQRLDVASQGKWLVFFYALTAAFVHFNLDEKKYVQILIYLIMPIGLYAVFQSFTGIDWVRGNIPGPFDEFGFFRARGLTHNSMTFGHILAVLFAVLTPFLLYRSFKERPNLEKALCGSLVFIFLALVFTFTRGAWVAVAAQAIVVLFFWNRRHATKALVIGAIVAVIFASASVAIRERIKSIGDPKYASTVERMMLWESNWHMFLDHPLLGIGAGRNQKEVEAYNIRLRGKSHPVANAHNNILHVLAGTGIFGFIFWATAMIWLFVNTLKRFREATTPGEKALHLGCIGAIIAFHVGGLTQTTFDDTEVRMLLCLWLAMSIAVAYRQSILRQTKRST